MEALNTLLLLLTALAIPGLINRTRARLAGRKGIRFAQHLYDVALLLRKGAVYSTTTSALFRIAPSVSLGSALVAALFIPVGDLQPVLSFDGDLVAFAYRRHSDVWRSSSPPWTPAARSKGWAPAARRSTAPWSNRR